MKSLSKLYRATMKHLLIPALIMGTMSIISTLLYLSGRIKEITPYGRGMFFRGQPTAFAIAPSLVVFMFLGAAVMTYMAFSYLNKRSASDFYHSLPYTRAENYWSRILAVLTYQVGIIALTLLGSLVLLSVTGTSFNPVFFPMLLLGYTAGSLLVIGGVALGMTITGTLLSNILVAGLILFLPRMLLFVTDQFIDHITNFHLIIGRMGILLNPVYNIATASLLDISRFWEYYGLSETLINPGSILYTGVLGMIYLGLGMILMKRRKSELAGNGASCGSVAGIYSALISVPILIYGFYGISGRSLSNLSYSSTMRLLIVLAVALAIFIVIGFALSTKWKTVLKSLPLFAAAIVVSLGVVFTATFIAKEMASYMPDREKIEYVTVNENNNGAYRYKPTYDYNQLLASNVKFSDDASIDIFYNTLGTNIEEWRQQMSETYTKGYSSFGQVLCEFKLKNGKSVYRNLTLYLKDSGDIYDMLTTKEEFVEAYIAFPENGTVHTYDDIDHSVIEAVWEKYKQEVEAKSDMDRIYMSSVFGYSQLFSYKYENGSRPWYITGFYIEGYEGSTPYIKSIGVSSETPETADYYMRAVNESKEKTFISDLRGAIEENDSQIRRFINVNIPAESGSTTNFAYASDMEEEEFEYGYGTMTKEKMGTLIDIFAEKDLSDISVQNPYAEVSYSQYGVYENDSVSYCCYVPLTESEVEWMEQMYEENEQY